MHTSKKVSSVLLIDQEKLTFVVDMVISRNPRILGWLRRLVSCGHVASLPHRPSSSFCTRSCYQCGLSAQRASVGRLTNPARVSTTPHEWTSELSGFECSKDLNQLTRAGSGMSTSISIGGPGGGTLSRKKGTTSTSAFRKCERTASSACKSPRGVSTRRMRHEAGSALVTKCTLSIPRLSP